MRSSKTGPGSHQSYLCSTSISSKMFRWHPLMVSVRDVTNRISLVLIGNICLYLPVIGRISLPVSRHLGKHYQYTGSSGSADRKPQLQRRFLSCTLLIVCVTSCVQCKRSNAGQKKRASTRKAGQKKRARRERESTRNVREEGRFLPSPTFLVLGLSPLVWRCLRLSFT